MSITTEAVERLNTFIVEGRLIRKAWTGTDAKGRETACLLAALAPQCGEDERASVCPADIMPEWLAIMTPSLDDRGSDSAWPGMVRRYASLAARWAALDAAAWLRVEYRFRAAAVREARSHTASEQVQAVRDRVIALCCSVVETGRVDASAFMAAEAAAAWAAEAEAAEAWAWAAEAARAARAAAEAAAWDRMTVALFEAIELELADRREIAK